MIGGKKGEVEMKKEYLYHGSPRKLKGKSLIPKKPHDLGKKRENLTKGIYATDVKNSAIAMAIICAKGVRSGSLLYRKKSVIYEGQPKQKYVYLYYLPFKTFKRTSKRSHQWVSIVKVKPTKIERLKVKNYLNLIRKATKEEVKKFYKKYGFKK
jgi:hypothetical protein